MKKPFKIENLVFNAEERAYNAGERTATWIKAHIKAATILSVGLVVIAVFGGIAALCGFGREIVKRKDR
jgi:hypothetical protein